ncbi:septum formation initiator family protein [Nocardioides zeae]|uniref:Septum formation initiator family protein n=1 Tax=Nocardioides imazamoxiresistens TaxID=3231893 RepID=A0ABU3PZW8_9ACTN|nr:septum formation initiator family protein [Nocardioides zeae]MDT9594411.1 septum formation initiator family protein [Nocardioides zeae]
MAEERRRKRPSRPAASRGPGRSRPSSRPSARRTPAAAAAARRPRPKFTGRAAILVLVLAVLTVSYASSLRAYLTQREHLGDLRAQIDTTTEDIRALEREKRRWEDPAFVEQQARERLDFVQPGETPYVVIGEDGEPLGSHGSLSEPVAGDEREVAPAWWETTWESVEAAGNPEEAAAQEQEQEPAEEIEGPPVGGEEEDE